MYKVKLGPNSINGLKQVIELRRVDPSDTSYIETQAQVPNIEYLFGKEGLLLYDEEADIFHVFYRERALSEEEKNQLARQYALKQIDFENLQEEDKLALKPLYPEWNANSSYYLDDIVRYEEDLYRVLQNHISRIAWRPNTATSLYVKIEIAQNPNNPEEVTYAWIQPTGAHDAYTVGDKVLFESKIYENLIDANTWSPAAYPAGWKEI